MAYSLRLPDALDAAARSRADYLGISINALICVALDAYLRGQAGATDALPDRQDGPDSGPKPATKAPSGTKAQPPAPHPSGLTRKERQAAYKAEQEARRAEFKRQFG